MFAEYYTTVVNASEETTAFTIKESKLSYVFRERGLENCPPSIR